MRSFFSRLRRRYRAAQAGRWATIISWNALFAFIPMVLLVVTLFSLLLRNPGFSVAIENRIASLGLTPGTRGEIRTALTAFRDRSGILAVVSFAGLLWSGSALFSTMDDALSRLYGIAARRFVRKRLMAVGMIFAFTALLIPLLISSTLLSEGARFSILPKDFPTPAAVLIQFVLGALDGTIIYAVIYHVVPHRRQTLRRILPGALLAGLLLEVCTLLLPLYTRLTDGLATYGVIFALMLLLITYFFFLGQITMLGGIVNVELDPDQQEVAAPAPL